MSTIKNRQEATAWQHKYDAGAPRVGDPAPDFELRDIQGEDPIRLSSFRLDKTLILPL